VRRFPNNRQPHTQLLTCRLIVKGPVDGVVVVVVPIDDGARTVVVVVVVVVVPVDDGAHKSTVVVLPVDDGRRIKTH